MQCPRCEQDAPLDAAFCPKCGAKVRTSCPHCGNVTSRDDNFCARCGHSLASAARDLTSRFVAPESYTPKHLAERILTSRSALEGERKQVTVLFCDIADSMALAERLGEEAMHALLNRFFDLALAEVHRFEGTINQFLGDGFMALFGAPLAHEDHARRAVLASLGLEQALREHAHDLGDGSNRLRVRMGLHTGFVVVGAIGNDLRMDYTAIGDTTNLAARLQQRAEPGTILTSDTTARLVSRDVVLEPIGTLEIRGKRAPVGAARVAGPRPRRRTFMSDDRVLSRFVGRNGELATLQDLMRRAEAGDGQVVEIVGEPGTGKSRLIHEFARTLESEHVTWLEGRCLSYGATITYLPIIDVLRAGCVIGEGDPRPVVAAKVRTGLIEAGLDPAETAPYVLHLLGVTEGAESVAQLPPDVVKRRTFGILREMTVNAAQRRPMVLVVEDVHWIDQTSVEYLLTLADCLAGAPILLLTTTRPETLAPWMDKLYATRLVLRPLSTADSLTLTRSVAVDVLPDPVTDTILRKAEGNPFFVEELTRAALEHGTDALPDTIQTVLAARIDRLEPPAKAVLQTAAVLGREFSAPLLDRVHDAGDIAPHVQALMRRELLYQRVGRDGTVYVFKHALIQDVAYETLLQHRRRELHGRVVNAIEVLHAGRLAEHVEHLAYHAFRGERWAKAVTYARDAGRKAAVRYANREAVATFEQALAALEHLPEHERESAIAIDLRFDLKNALIPLAEWPRALPLLDQAEQLARAANDRRRLGWSLMHKGHGSYMLGAFFRAREQEQSALDIALADGDTALEVGANYYLGHAWFNLGEYATAARVFAHTSARVSRESTGERFGLILLPASSARSYQAWMLALMGDFDAALALAVDGVTIGEAVDHPFSIVNARLCAGLSRAMRGDLAGAAVDLQRGKAVCEERNIPYMSPHLAGCIGWLQSLAGSAADGLAVIEASEVRVRAVGFMVNVLHLQPLLVEAQVLARRFDRAERCARRALTLVQHHGTRGWEAMLLRMLGQIAADRDTPDFVGAVHYYRDALELASHLSMRPLVAHCHAGLTTLYQRIGKRQEAHEHFTIATTMYRDMGMTYWLERAETELLPD